VNLKASIAHFLFLAVFFCFHAEIIHPQNRTAFPRVEADPKALEYYNQESQGYSWMQLAEISLWASGNPARESSVQTTPSNIEKIGVLITNMLNSSELPSSQKERAEFILTFMHRNILRTYSIHQTRLDTIFTNGSFNCVSSGVLYIILCEAAGIKTSGVVTRQHAFVIAHIDGEYIDVETTNRYGFDPGNRKEFHDQIGRLTGFSYVPAQNYRDRQTISKMEFISLIMNNRIADLEKTNRYAESVPIAIDRASLLLGSPLAATSQNNYNEALFSDPRKDLMDRLINYGASLLRANREEDAIQWVLLASPLYRDPNRWYELISVSVNNRISRFISAKRPLDARTFLDSNKTFLTEDDFAKLDVIIIDADILSRANLIQTAFDGDAVLNAITQERANGKIEEKRANELIIFAVQKTAAALSAAPDRNWRSAIQYIEFAGSLYGKQSELEQILRTYRNNLATEYHNKFAAEWNRRNYNEAERILNEGLAEFPDNRQLQADRDIVNRQRARQ